MGDELLCFVLRIVKELWWLYGSTNIKLSEKLYSEFINNWWAHTRLI